LASKRLTPAGSWEYTIKNKKMLPKPWRHYTTDEEQGDALVARVEALLEKGIVPVELADHGARYLILAELIRDYLSTDTVSDPDIRILNVTYARHGEEQIQKITLAWVENWISGMKTELNLAPGTIRHHVGALGRCLAFGGRKNIASLIINPVKQLPKNYSSYTRKDVKMAQAIDEDHFARTDESRTRRLSEDGEEEQRMRAIMNGAKPKREDGTDKERALLMTHRAAMELLFELALETAMRMREIYTLTINQVDFEKATIFLEKTKNGNKRQVPMSTVAIKSIKAYFEIVQRGERGMQGFKFSQVGKGKPGELRLFPFWDGEDTVDELAKITSILSQRFKTIFVAAQVDDFRFHDLRHEATSRLFERTNLGETEIMSITGHSSSVMLKRYANFRGSNLAKRMW